MVSVDNIEESVWTAIAGRANFPSLPLGTPIKDVSDAKETFSDNVAAVRLLGGFGVPLGPAALLLPDGTSLALSMAVAVFVAFMAAAIVLKLRGLEDRRRQPWEDEEGGRWVEEPAGAGDGVRRLKEAIGVSGRFS